MTREDGRDLLSAKIRGDYQRQKKRRKIRTVLVVTIAALGCIAAFVWLKIAGAPNGTEIAAPKNATADYGFTLTAEDLDGVADDADGSDDANDSDDDGAADSDAEEDAPITVAVYEDFLCSSCKVFHETSAEYLQEQVAAGTITLTYHPFTFLLSQSTDEYAQRAANAAACVANAADVGAYAKMHDLLMESQPKTGGPGLSDSELIDLAVEAGAPDVDECITKRKFDEWVTAATEAGSKVQVTTTPTVRINDVNVVRSVDGVETMPGPEELQYAIEELQ